MTKKKNTRHDDLDLDLALLSRNEEGKIQYPEPGELEGWVAELEQLLQATDDPSTQYVPSIRAVRSKSKGYVQRIPGLLTSRHHELLSRGEGATFDIHDFDRERYSNVREQFPLPWELTWLVSRREALPHPFYNQKPAQMSVDFLFSQRKGGWKAVDFKMSCDAKKPKVKQKLALVAATLRLVGITHQVLTEKTLPARKVRNIRFLRILALPYDRPPLSYPELELAEPLLRERLKPGILTVFEAAKQVSALTGVPASRLTRGSLWCIANNRWRVDLNETVGPDYPLTFLRAA